MGQCHLFINRWVGHVSHRMDGRWDGLEHQILLGIATPRTGDWHQLKRGLCIGRLRFLKDRVARPTLDNKAKIRRHHIMADEQIPQARIGLRLHHQVKHLRLNAHVKRRDRLIRGDQLGIQRKCAGNRDPLTLTTGSFMRKTAQKTEWQRDPAKQHRHPVIRDIAKSW